jgi:hypothetical protein
MAVVARRPGNVPELHASQSRLLHLTSSRKKAGSGHQSPQTQLQATLPSQTPVQEPTALARTPERASPGRSRGRGTKVHSMVAAAATATTAGKPNPIGPTDRWETPVDRSSTPHRRAAPRWGDLQTLYSPPRPRRHHPNDGVQQTSPTIYTRRTELPSSPTLPPPERPTEGEGTNELARGGSRETGRLPFRFSREL